MHYVGASPIIVRCKHILNPPVEKFRGSNYLLPQYTYQAWVSLAF
jgi:hypothetical protein